MTRKLFCHLMNMLAEVPYPRNNKGKRHPLVSILTLVVIGLMCGHLSKLGRTHNLYGQSTRFHT